MSGTDLSFEEFQAVERRKAQSGASNDSTVKSEKKNASFGTSGVRRRNVKGKRTSVDGDLGMLRIMFEQCYLCVCTFINYYSVYNVFKFVVQCRNTPFSHIYTLSFPSFIYV